MSSYVVLDTWNGNRIACEGSKDKCLSYMQGNNVYQMNYSKLVLRIKE